MKSQLILCSAALILASSALQAQSFNVDVGSNSASNPASSYGAAAAQPGVWTRISSDLPATTTPLLDISTGATTAVTLVTSGGLGNFTINNFLTNFDDERLLDDAQDLGLGTVSWTFSGLQNGNYEIYTYGWAPDSALIRTNVAVVSATEAAQQVGGTWTGAHVQGVTFAKHTRSVTSGTIQINVNTSVFDTGLGGAINGFQIKRLPDAGPITPFCFGDGSSGLCPCSNFGATAKGCDNSAGTGGAQLLATGSLAADTLQFSSSGELATALTIFLQGTLNQSPAAVFGDGLRCTGGNLKRLYVKSAVGGVAIAPVAGDPSVRVQSSNLGDPIAAGSTRFYQAYYRDANASFCPAPTGNTFNISSGLSILWP